MMATRKTGPLLALAFSAAGLAGAWFAYEALEKPLAVDQATAAAQTAKPAAVPIPAAGQFKMQPMSDFQAILERPAFSPSRRPKAGAPVVVNQDLAVTVTIISGTPDRPVVNLKPKDGSPSVILRPGQKYRGWTLSEIKSRSLVFRRGDEVVQVEMKFEAAPQFVGQRGDRPEARLPQGGQRNLRKDRQRQQQNLQQKARQNRQQQQRQLQQQQQRQLQQQQQRQPQQQQNQQQQENQQNQQGQPQN